MKHSVLGTIPDDFAAAKEALRDRLAVMTEKSIPQALATRKAKRFHAAPGINLVGLGIGEKVTSRKRTGEMCVRVLVARKFPKGKISRAQQIPATINGLPTDVEAVGYPRKFQIPQRQRHRPVPGGVSVGLDLNAVDFRFAGTLGMIVSERQTPGTLFALSNNHVLADENRVNNGAGVVQPGTLDSTGSGNGVGSLASFVPLKFDNRRNWMDAAIAAFDGGTAVDRTILEVGAPTGSAMPSLNLLVRKSGRTTGLTEGIVREIAFDVFNIEYDQGFVRMDDVIVIEGITAAFSKPGDSGSAIVDPQGRVVALLFAGSDVVTFAIPIRRILRRFKVRVAA
jgi:hypothetical protein